MVWLEMNKCQGDCFVKEISVYVHVYALFGDYFWFTMFICFTALLLNVLLCIL